MTDAFLGIDVGKSEFHCALRIGEDLRTNHFPNSPKGFTKLHHWLKNRKIAGVHACLEATGGWSEELAQDLYERGHLVSLVNPLSIKAFGQSELSRTKTDRADAALIARYCEVMKPTLWQPPTPAQRRLQQLARRRMALDDMRTQERNRLAGPGISEVSASIESTIAFLDNQISDIDEEIRKLIDDDPTLRGRRDLLESIPGVGERLIATIMGELPNITEFRSGKALAAFAGLCPHEFRSGSSVSSSWLSRRGSSRLRRILYMPAVVAKQHNPVLKAFAERLRAAGKRSKQIITAVMRRLLVIIYGVIKSNRPFDPSYRSKRESANRYETRRPIRA